MNQQQQRMAAVGTDKELSDLLDFSMMFPLPVANGKNRPTTLASTQFGGSGLDERPGSGSWGTGDQNSSTFDQGRQSYGEGPHYGEHRDLPSHSSVSSSPFLGAGLVGKSSERASYSTFGRDTGMPGLNQTGFLPSEMGIASPSTLSPTGVKGGSQYFSYPNNPRRRGAESNIDGQPKKVRKVPPGLPSSGGEGFSQLRLPLEEKWGSAVRLWCLSGEKELQRSRCGAAGGGTSLAGSGPTASCPRWLLAVWLLRRRVPE